MYSAELERHKKEKEEWKRKADRLEDRASALQVNQLITDQRIRSPDVIGEPTEPTWPVM